MPDNGKRQLSHVMHCLYSKGRGSLSRDLVERAQTMPVIERSIMLNVPAERVFRYLADPAHYPEFCPAVVEVKDVHRHSADTIEFEWVFKMIGVRFEGEAEVHDTHHDQQLDLHFWGGIRGTLTWRVLPFEDRVGLETRVDYTLPVPLLKKHIEETIIQHNEHAIECMHTSLKTLLEEKVTIP